MARTSVTRAACFTVHYASNLSFVPHLCSASLPPWPPTQQHAGGGSTTASPVTPRPNTSIICSSDTPGWRQAGPSHCASTATAADQHSLPLPPPSTAGHAAPGGSRRRLARALCRTCPPSSPLHRDGCPGACAVRRTARLYVLTFRVVTPVRSCSDDHHGPHVRPLLPPIFYKLNAWPTGACVPLPLQHPRSLRRHCLPSPSTRSTPSAAGCHSLHDSKERHRHCRRRRRPPTAVPRAHAAAHASGLHQPCSSLAVLCLFASAIAIACLPSFPSVLLASACLHAIRVCVLIARVAMLLC